MFSMFFILSYILSDWGTIQNIICNGDFQIYSIPKKFLETNGQYIMWDTFSQNTSCWYRIPVGSGNIQVQTPSYATFWTKVIQIIGVYDPYALCQKVIIQIGSQYSLSVDIVKPKPVTSATAFLYLNNVLVGSVTNSNYLISSKIIYNFTALTTNYEICINGSFVASSVTKNFIDDFSPLIDNVSLIKIPLSNISSQSNSSVNNINTANATNITIIPITNITNTSNTPNQTQFSLINPITDVNIYLELSYNEDEGTILLVSTQSLVFQQYLYMLNFGKIYIEDEEQTDVIYSLDQVNLLFNITINVVRDYDLKTIYVAFPKQIKELYLFRLIVFINGQNINIYVVNSDMIKIIKTVDPVSNAIINGISDGYGMLKLYFCSYFVFNIINFYSLTLMYNFLGFSAQPFFSRIALQKLGQIFYKRNNLFSYVQSTFSIPGLSQNLQFKNFMQDERIDKFNNGYSWFGNMGITSNFPANNLENIAMMIILIIKLTILALFYKAFPKFSQNIFGKQKNFVYLFIVQFLCMSPLMTVSAFSTFLNSGVSKFTSKVNFLLHLWIEFMIALCPFIYLLKIIEKKNEPKKIKKNTKIIQMQFFEYLLNVLLPILVIIRNQISFFVVTTIYFIILLSFYIYSFYNFPILTRIMKSAMILMLTTHHLSFMLIYIVGVVSQKLGRFETLNTLCKIAGLIVIFTVLCGGLTEVLHFIVKIVLKVIKKVKKLCNKQDISTIETKKKKKKARRRDYSKKTIQNNKKEYPDYIYAQKIYSMKSNNSSSGTKNIKIENRNQFFSNNGKKAEEKLQKFYDLQNNKITLKVIIKKNKKAKNDKLIKS